MPGVRVGVSRFNVGDPRAAVRAPGWLRKGGFRDHSGSARVAWTPPAGHLSTTVGEELLPNTGIDLAEHRSDPRFLSVAGLPAVTQLSPGELADSKRGTGEQHGCERSREHAEHHGAEKEARAHRTVDPDITNELVLLL